MVPSAAGCSVSVDVAGGALAVRHLLQQGHRDVVHVSGPTHLAQRRARHRGARLAHREAGAVGRLRHLEAERLDAAAGRDAGARLLGMSPRPTAVFCANDLLALGLLQTLYHAGLLQTLYHAGLRVPEDIALVGYDDIEFAAAAAVPLTSVRQPAFLLGRTAADLLIEETGDDAQAHRHQRVVLQPELVVRASSLLLSGH